MAKKFSMKAGSSTAGLPKYRDIKQSRDGGDSLQPADHIAKSGRGPLKGTSNARHASIKPSASSGSLGSHATPFKMGKGYKEQRGSDNPITRKTKSTKPNR